MSVTPYATFKSAFPDDSIEDNGDIVVPGGQNIMRAIHNCLAARGYRLSDIEQHSHYGWSFDLRGEEGRFWLLVQYPEPWLLTVHDSRMIWSRIFGGEKRVCQLLDQCRACLASIPQISAISWMSLKEYEADFQRPKAKERNA